MMEKSWSRDRDGKGGSGAHISMGAGEAHGDDVGETVTLRVRRNAFLAFLAAGLVDAGFAGAAGGAACFVASFHSSISTLYVANSFCAILDT